MIKGENVTLRAISLDDLDKLHEWANDSELWSNLGGWHFPYNRESTKEWIKSISGNDKNNQHFAISLHNGNIVGTINMTNIDWKNRSSTYGIMLGNAEERGKGYASEAVKLLTKYVFEELGLIRLESDILETNKRSLNFHKKLGWNVEGEKKMADFRAGKWNSKYLIAYTIHEYQAEK